eukprot:m.633420 g.633420  ORF g.633420 m.633420 type:complete len:473 (+) comp58300_c0_seq3:41-1459(+)
MDDDEFLYGAASERTGEAEAPAREAADDFLTEEVDSLAQESAAIAESEKADPPHSQEPENNNEEEEDEDDDDDDSENEIELVIHAVPKQSLGNDRAHERKPAQPPAFQAKIDLRVEGNINGVPIYDASMDQFADKPWLKAGADLTDYFNYGFDETTWKEYQEKQRQIRSELQQRALILQHQAPGTRAVMPPAPARGHHVMGGMTDGSLALPVPPGFPPAGIPPAGLTPATIPALPIPPSIPSLPQPPTQIKLEPGALPPNTAAPGANVLRPPVPPSFPPPPGPPGVPGQPTLPTMPVPPRMPFHPSGAPIPPGAHFSGQMMGPPMPPVPPSFRPPGQNPFDPNFMMAPPFFPPIRPPMGFSGMPDQAGPRDQDHPGEEDDSEWRREMGRAERSDRKDRDRGRRSRSRSPTRDRRDRDRTGRHRSRSRSTSPGRAGAERDRKDRRERDGGRERERDRRREDDRSERKEKKERE